MKSFRLWHLVAVGVVLSLLSTQARGEDRKQYERKAKAALALAATKQTGFVNLAPLPREVPKVMPAKKPCVCGDDCKCKDGKCPGGCPVEPAVVPKKDAAKKADPSQPAPVGYQWQKRGGEDWKLVPVAAAQGVAAPRPFAAAGSSSTPITPAIVAGGISSQSSGFYPAANTYTLVPRAGILGVTNCAPGRA